MHMSLEEQAKTLDFTGVVVSLIVSAFGFVAALFWRDAIKAFIDEVVPAGEGLAFQFYAAIIVTVIAVVAIYVVSKYLSKIQLKKAIELSKNLTQLEKRKKQRKKRKQK
jgi:uncharacterized membrane protein YbhN (UPF0104 family)